MKSGEGILGVSGGARLPAGWLTSSCLFSFEQRTYVRQTTVIAGTDFGLIGVDKDSRMPGRAATPVAGHHPVMCPPDRLLVNQLHRRMWVRLPDSQQHTLPFAQ